MDNVQQPSTRGTVRLRLRLSDFMAKATGVREMPLDVDPGTTLPDILRFLEDRMGPEYKGAILEKSGAVQPEILISHQGRIVPRAQLAQTLVNDGDDIKIMISAQGG